MKLLISIALLFSTTVMAQWAQPGLTFKFGTASVANKSLIFDTNDGASNKRLTIDGSTKEFSFSSDLLKFGDGAPGDKDITFNRGGSNPAFRWNETTDKLQFSNDGSAFFDFASTGTPPNFRTVTANDTLTTADQYIECDTSSNDITLTLPTAVGNDGVTFDIKKTAAGNLCILDPNGSQTIDDELLQTLLTLHTSVTIFSDGANWLIK